MKLSGTRRNTQIITSPMLTLFFIVLCTGLHAQTVLRHETHGYFPNIKNELHIIEKISPGDKGYGQLWDFSGIPIKEDFSGVFDDPAVFDKASLFHQANVVLEEFGNLFFLNSNGKSTKQWGYVSVQGHYIVYSEPFVKMNYPFAYGDSFSGDFKSELFDKDGTTTTITGEYHISADATGGLKLPGNIFYPGALRVHEVKTSQHIKNDRLVIAYLEAYRWYVSNHRFPVLSVINNKWTYADGRTRESTVAAYNPVFIYHADVLSVDTPDHEFSFNVYPNPASEYANIRFFVDNPSKVQLNMFDYQGRLVAEFENINEFEGEWTTRFSIPAKGLQPGIYTIRLAINEKLHTRKIVII